MAYFVLAPALRIYTKRLKVTVAFSRKGGIRCVLYLDYFLFMNESKEGLCVDFKTTLSILESKVFLIYLVHRHFLKMYLNIEG